MRFVLTPYKPLPFNYHTNPPASTNAARSQRGVPCGTNRRYKSPTQLHATALGGVHGLVCLTRETQFMNFLTQISFCTEPSITLKSGGRRPSRSSLPCCPSVRRGSNLLSRASPHTMSPRVPFTPKRKNSTRGPVSVRSSPPVRSAILQRYLP
jgi:hypothetical protein